MASLAGKISGVQHRLVMAAIDRMEQGAVLSICDRDTAGDEATRELENLFRELRRNDLTFGDDRPLEEGLDWNDVLRQQLRRGNDLSLIHDIGM